MAASGDAAALLDAMVTLGLATYTRDFEDPEPPLQLIHQEAREVAGALGIGRVGWPDQREALAEAWSRSEGPLRRLGLKRADLFLLGLAAACERRRTVALAIACLQAPAASGRLSVHLALDLLQSLFEEGPGDAMALAVGRLVEAGIVTLEGDDAMPLRSLAIRLPLWRALAGGPAAWPGCRTLGEVGRSGVDAGALDRVARAIAGGEAGGVLLRGPPGSGRGAVAHELARRLGLVPIECPLAVVRDDAGFATVCRTVGWLPVVRLLPDLGEAALLDGPRLPCAVLAATHGAVHADGLIELEMAPPPASERLRLWRDVLGTADVDAGIHATACLYPAAIGVIGRSARLRAEGRGRAVNADDLIDARLALAPEGLGRLAHKVTRRVDAAAMVTTSGLADDLAALISRCRSRETVWDGLGPSLAASTTRGVRALFAGDSGTGKTMAASYVASALAAPLFRCDLAAVMNKYIGESEKNLGLLLDHAEAADVVLLFDEADALFGRRSEGSETGERYANMLTNYLLTRLEAHNGIVILTANAKMRIDPAFWRRLDHVIDFPLPGYSERLALWRSHLGGRAPSDAVLEQLAAYCELPGGGVRNAVLAAAAMAPSSGAIGADLLTAALRREYAKLRRTMPAPLALAVRAAE